MPNNPLRPVLLASRLYPKLAKFSGLRSIFGNLSGEGAVGNVCHVGHTALDTVSNEFTDRGCPYEGRQLDDNESGEVTSWDCG
jgi:hypothetical protein